MSYQDVACGLSDLLPPFFDAVVMRHTGKRLLRIERDTILCSIANCIRESLLRRIEMEHGGLSDYLLDYLLLDRALPTVDHFATQWVQRSEIVDYIKLTSGLPKCLSELALSAIERRLDSLIASSGQVSVAGLGTISVADQEFKSTFQLRVPGRFLPLLSQYMEQPRHWDLFRARERSETQIDELTQSLMLPDWKVSYSIEPSRLFAEQDFNWVDEDCEDNGDVCMGR